MQLIFIFGGLVGAKLRKVKSQSEHHQHAVKDDEKPGDRISEDRAIGRERDGIAIDVGADVAKRGLVEGVRVDRDVVPKCVETHEKTEKIGQEEKLDGFFVLMSMHGGAPFWTPPRYHGGRAAVLRRGGVKIFYASFVMMGTPVDWRCPSQDLE